MFWVILLPPGLVDVGCTINSNRLITPSSLLYHVDNDWCAKTLKDEENALQPIPD